MKMKRIISLAIAFSMLAVSFAMVGSQNVKAGFIETGIPVGWGGSFTPRDIEWDDSGHYCLVVGASGGGASNAYIYNGFTDTWQPVSGAPNLQILTSVCWDKDTELFWVCGDTGGAPETSVYDIPYFGNSFATPSPTPSLMTYNAIEADDAGNVLVGGAGGSMFAYNKVDNTWYPYNPGSVWTTRSITFDTIGKRFYIAAEDSGTTHAGLLYSDITPLDDLSMIHVSTMPLLISDLYSIAWNPVTNYGLAVGTGVYRVGPYIGNNELVWKVIQPNKPSLSFSDVAWDTDGYNEAAIFGQNVTMGRAVYWRYYNTNPTLILGYTDAVYANYLCGSIKPPASPKYVFIPTPLGGIMARIQAYNDSTRITANAVVPKLWWIGFNDTALNSRMETQVTVDTDYIFSFQYNYSLGFNLCEFIIQAWHDGGAVGGLSNYPAAPDATTRNLAFTITCDFTGNAVVTYPDTPNLEVQTAPATVQLYYVNPIDPTGDQDHYRVFVPVWLGNQIRAADGSGFGSGDMDYSKFKNQALMDPNSWDFSVTVQDATSGGYNTSYGEFGIQEAWNVSVTGSPTGNAPPGSNDNALGPNSNIVYSANTLYYVSVAIPDLFLNGNPLALNWIPAGSVSVTNINPDAVGFSDIPIETAFIGPGVPWYVWGISVPMTLMNPLNNGLVSAGWTVSDYTNPATAFTELYWEVNVPGGTPEGIYWGTITVTIDN